MGRSKSETYTLTEMARVAGVTTASVSKYVKRQSLKPIKTGKNNAKYFSSAVLEQIKAYYQDKSEKRETNNEYRPASKDDVIRELRARIDELTSTNDLLRDELKIKNDQISSAIQLANQAQQLDLTTHQQKGLPEKEVKTTVEKPSEKKKSFWSFLKG